MSDSDSSEPPSLKDPNESDDEEVLTLDQLRQSVAAHNQNIRSGGVQSAINRANESRQAGNAEIQKRNGDPSRAAYLYEEAMDQLWPFDSKPDAAWPLILCLSNYALAASKHRW